MKTFFIILTLLGSLYASKLEMPTSSFIADGGVTDIFLTSNKLYGATSVGIVDIFSLKSKKIIQRVTLQKMKNFLGESSTVKIFSVDYIDGKLLILAQAKRGYREIYIYENSKLTKIISASERLSIAKAKFIDKNTLLLALLGNDIISFDIAKHKENWKRQASLSAFSNFALNEDKSEVVVADESGELHIFATKNAKLIQSLKGENLDNVFDVAFKSNIIAAAGKDRRCVIYDLNKKSSYYKESHFFIFGVGLSPSGKLSAYTSDETNTITLFETDTKRELTTFGGNSMTVSEIIFTNENEFYVASNAKTINFYKIKGAVK